MMTPKSVTLADCRRILRAYLNSAVLIAIDLPHRPRRIDHHHDIERSGLFTLR
jgi:hypothetical protein